MPSLAPTGRSADLRPHQAAAAHSHCRPVVQELLRQSKHCWCRLQRHPPALARATPHVCVCVLFPQRRRVTQPLGSSPFLSLVCSPVPLLRAPAAELVCTLVCLAGHGLVPRQTAPVTWANDAVGCVSCHDRHDSHRLSTGLVGNVEATGAFDASDQHGLSRP